MSGVINRAVDYSVQGKSYKGQLLYQQDATPDRALLMAPNFLGVSERAVAQAEKCLDENTVIFILDPFGAQVRPGTLQEAMDAMAAARADSELLRQVLLAALATLREEAGALGVAADRLAVFGFCFGGACALELARCGADARAFISFHGLLSTRQPATAAPVGPVLVLNGADDPMVTAEDRQAFMAEMDAVKADWTLVNYGATVHSFTDPNANVPGRSMYNPTVARRAFAAMADLLDEVLA